MLPQLKEIKQSKLTIDAFKGLCHKENVPIGAFYDMKNMACDDYPVLSTRGHRGLGDRLEDASGLTAGEEVYWVRNDELVYTGGSVRLPLDGVERKLVVMGAFLYVFPDKVYIDTKDFPCTTWNGSMSVRRDTRWRFLRCRLILTLKAAATRAQ